MRLLFVFSIVLITSLINAWADNLSIDHPLAAGECDYTSDGKNKICMGSDEKYRITPIIATPRVDNPKPLPPSEQSGINGKTAALMMQQCVNQHLVLGDYLSDATLSPADNMVKVCAPEFTSLLMACHDSGNIIENCSINFKNEIAVNIQKATGIY